MSYWVDFGLLMSELEFDDGIAVDSVEELKNKFDTYIKENFPETETTILKD